MWLTHPSFGSVTKATILDPSDPSLCLVGGLRGGRIASAVVAGFVLRARTRLSKDRPSRALAITCARLCSRRLTAVHYYRMRFPAGSTLLRIRALPVPVDKLRCRSPRAVRIGEEGIAGILRSGSKLISAYYLTLPLVAACSCA